MLWSLTCVVALLGPTADAVAQASGNTQAPAQTPSSAGPQTQPGPSAGSPPQPQPQTGPQTKPKNRREMMRDAMRQAGIDIDKPKIRYEKGTFMITGSIEVDPQVYDGKALVKSWIEKIETEWKQKLPLAAQMGNSGRVTYKGVLTRKQGLRDLDKIEPSGLDSLDQAAGQVLEEFRPNFTLPEGFPGDFVVFYLKFHYNIYSEL
jgi:outer membrane biosynthesis protein TonB